MSRIEDVAAQVLEQAADAAPAVASFIDPAGTVAEAAGLGVKAILKELAQLIGSRRKTIEQILAEIQPPPPVIETDWLDDRISEERAKGGAHG